MTGSQAAVADATAAVFVDGRRVGSAVLVDRHHLVTARHVLLQYDHDAGCKVLADKVDVEFPSIAHGQARRAPASRIDLGAHAAGVDVAVLHLGDAPPSWLPSPVAVWSAARMPDRVAVFGYPLAEGPLNGIWRPFTLAGPTTAGAMQLDWTSNAGTFPGHSGGPVVDATGNSLTGILVEGSEEGRFDRFLPVTLIANVWPQLRRRWLMIGAHRTDARGHFTQRSRGQRSTARGGDMFRGRRAALLAVRRWLTDEESPGRPLVLTGQPGAGKSSVLARSALAIEADHGRPGLAFHARAATVGDFLGAVAELIGMEPPEETNQVIKRLASMPQQPPTILVVDALDEAASESDRRQISVALSDIAVLPGLRVGVATRPLAAGSSYRYVPGGLLSALGVTGNDSPGLVDLDTDTYFDAEDLGDFAAAMLAQDGMDHPGPRRAAWQSYRAERSVCNRLADVIAERAGRNFLVAAMASAALSTARDVIDPATIGFNPAVIPASVGEALDKYFDQLNQSRRERQRGLLNQDELVEIRS